MGSILQVEYKVKCSTNEEIREGKGNGAESTGKRKERGEGNEEGEKEEVKIGKQLQGLRFLAIFIGLWETF